MEGFTELEAINIAVENGVSDGSELQSATWKKRGALKGDSVEALVRKLKQVYETVEVDGKGKKRRYYLENKKSEITKKETNHKGKIPTPQDDLMKEYIYNKLLTIKNGTNFTISRWVDELKFPNSYDFNLPKIEEEIKYWYRGQYYLNGILYNPKQFASSFTREIFNRSKGVITQQFKKLESEGHITHTYWYKGKVSSTSFGYNKDETNIDITFEDYTNFREREKELVEEQGGNIQAYRIQKNQIRGFNSKKYKEIYDKVQPILEDGTDLEYVYSTIEVNLIDAPQLIQDADYKKFIAAYYTRFVELISQRQTNEKYKNEIDKLQNRFFYFNSMIFIGTMEFEPFKGFKELLQDAKDNHDEEVNDYLLDYMANKSCQDMDGNILVGEIEKAEKEKRRNTFGKVE